MSRTTSHRKPIPESKPQRHHTAQPAALNAEFIGRLQAAALISVNVQTIDKWLAEAKLRKYKPARRVLIRRTELLALVEAGLI